MHPIPASRADARRATQSRANSRERTRVVALRTTRAACRRDLPGHRNRACTDDCVGAQTRDEPIRAGPLCLPEGDVFPLAGRARSEDPPFPLGIATSLMLASRVRM